MTRLQPVPAPVRATLALEMDDGSTWTIELEQLPPEAGVLMRGTVEIDRETEVVPNTGQAFIVRRPQSWSRCTVNLVGKFVEATQELPPELAGGDRAE